MAQAWSAFCPHPEFQSLILGFQLPRPTFWQFKHFIGSRGGAWALGRGRPSLAGLGFILRVAMGGRRVWGRTFLERAQQGSLWSGAEQSTCRTELCSSWGRWYPLSLSASSQVVKPTCTPPMPPVKPRVQGANPGPTEVSPSPRAVPNCRASGAGCIPSAG